VELVYRAGIYSSVLLPGAQRGVPRLPAQYPELLKHTASSLARVVIGVSLSIVTAIPFGLVIGNTSGSTRSPTGRSRSSLVPADRPDSRWRSCSSASATKPAVMLI